MFKTKYKHVMKAAANKAKLEALRAAEEDKTQEVLLMLAEQVKELTARVARLEPLVQDAVKKTTPAQWPKYIKP